MSRREVALIDFRGGIILRTRLSLETQTSHIREETREDVIRREDVVRREAEGEEEVVREEITNVLEEDRSSYAHIL